MSWRSGPAGPGPHAAGMAHSQKPHGGRSPVRLRLNIATHTVEALGPTADGVPLDLKRHLGALVDARDAGDVEAFAAAVAAVYDILDRVEIEWVMGGGR